MRMGQNLAEIERAFFEEIEEDRDRRSRLMVHATQRSRRRRALRTKRRGSIRFALLVLTLLATAAIVTIAMFETLYYVMG